MLIFQAHSLHMKPAVRRVLLGEKKNNKSLSFEYIFWLRLVTVMVRFTNSCSKWLISSSDPLVLISCVSWNPSARTCVPPELRPGTFPQSLLSLASTVMFLFIACLDILLPSFTAYKIILLPTNRTVTFKYSLELRDSGFCTISRHSSCLFLFAFLYFSELLSLFTVDLSQDIGKVKIF